MSNTTLVGLMPDARCQMPAPAGVTPDFNIHHITETQQSFILAYSITLGLATLTLGTRLYTTFFIVRLFGLDDSKCFETQSLTYSNPWTVVVLLAMVCQKVESNSAARSLNHDRDSPLDSSTSQFN
jgi:hypothetical protein